jgi:hypothetical protein
MLSKCVQCGFNIRQNEEFCLNCGEFNYSNKTFWQINTVPKIGSMIVLLVSFFSISFFSNNFDFISFLMLSITLGFIAFLVISIFYDIKRNIFKENTAYFTLQFKEKTITKRIAELTKRKIEIDSVLSKINESSSRNLMEIRQKLLSATEIIDSQFLRYGIQKYKIGLVRLQNKISPYLENIYTLNSAQTEDGINESELVIKEITELKQNISSNFQDTINLEHQNLLNQFDETSESCEKLREVLLSKKAFKALQGIQPIDDVETNYRTKELSEKTEIFNLKTTLTDFSESFDQLETEYKRLLADNEVSQKLLNYEN